VSKILALEALISVYVKRSPTFAQRHNPASLFPRLMSGDISAVSLSAPGDRRANQPPLCNSTEP
jgi:hypothetical protein